MLQVLLAYLLAYKGRGLASRNRRPVSDISLLYLGREAEV
jgi:hypothetical protein